MKYYYIALAGMLSYLVVYCIACYHVYLKPKTVIVSQARQVPSQKTYCAPAFLFPPTVKTGQY